MAKKNHNILPSNCSSLSACVKIVPKNFVINIVKAFPAAGHSFSRAMNLCYIIVEKVCVYQSCFTCPERNLFL